MVDEVKPSAAIQKLEQSGFKTFPYGWLLILALAALVGFNTLRVSNLHGTWSKVEMNEWVYQYRESINEWVNEMRRENPTMKIPKAPKVPHIKVSDDE